MPDAGPSKLTENDPTTPGVDRQEIQNKLKGILEHPAIDLATSSNGENWCSNAFFAALDDEFTLTLILESQGATLRNVRANPNVGIKIVPAGFTDPFAQGVATATVRDAGERQETFDALLHKEPQVRGFLDAPIEAVVLQVGWWRVTHVAGGWLPGKLLAPEGRAAD
jgi:uncharacterized protein YhbP (UPF0306 family)